MAEQKHISVRAAEPVGDQVIDPVLISISGHYPSSTKEDLEHLRQAFKIDAWKIFNALRSLPGGTFDQLLILMLQKSATSFVVPHDFHDEQKPSSMLALLEKAFPIIEEEAERRASFPTYDDEEGEYWSEMRELANEISAEIDRAYGKESSKSDPELCPHGFGFVEYCPDCNLLKAAESAALVWSSDSASVDPEEVHAMLVDAITGVKRAREGREVKHGE